ncbi:hypothetical protein QBC39DRAFT_176979 [Podospora conica]|nr:hypothetical protein QBC39DRAFT_176979 [Schizothecium conicum]
MQSKRHSQGQPREAQPRGSYAVESPHNQASLERHPQDCTSSARRQGRSVTMGAVVAGRSDGMVFRDEAMAGGAKGAWLGRRSRTDETRPSEMDGAVERARAADDASCHRRAVCNLVRHRDLALLLVHVPSSLLCVLTGAIEATRRIDGERGTRRTSSSSPLSGILRRHSLSRWTLARDWIFGSSRLCNGMARGRTGREGQARSRRREDVCSWALTGEFLLPGACLVKRENRRGYRRVGKTLKAARHATNPASVPSLRHLAIHVTDKTTRREGES